MKRIRQGYYYAAPTEVQENRSLREIARQKIGSVMGSSHNTPFTYLGNAENDRADFYHGYDTTVIVRERQAMIFGEKVMQVKQAHRGLERALSIKLFTIAFY